MASNQRTRGLDKSTRNTLSALDWVLQQDDTARRRDDEFTLIEYIAAMKANGVELPERTAYKKLDDMVRCGKLKKRKLSANGCFRNVYSKAQ